MKKLLYSIFLLLLGMSIGSMPSSSQLPMQQLPIQVTSSVTSSLIAKAYPGYIYSFAGTTGSTGGCFFLFNATSLPGNGSVTPATVPLQASANTTVSMVFPPSNAYLSVGIVIGFSSTCGLTFTASSTALISAMVQ